MLLQVAELVLPQRLKPGLLAYCPTMDLVAVATEDEQVQVFRLNGQKVFGVTKRNGNAAVTAICWKPNGRALIVAYEGGSLSLVSTYTGKVINQIASSSFPKSSVCRLGWGINFTDPVAVRSLLESGQAPPGAGVAAKKAVQRGGLLDEALARGLRSLEIEIPLDLPADLRNLDIEASLPKLSVLPSSGPNDDAFSTRASIDTVFHTAKKDSNESADVVLVSFEDGTVHLSIYDFFELGSFRDLVALNIGRVVRHCNHPYSSTHGLLLANSQGHDSLSFVPMDLKLIPDTGKYLSLLASKSGQIQNLIRYMKATIAQICADFKASQDLPRKFMRNAEEDLQEKEQNTFVNAIYHFAATGNCSPILKDWLIDQLGDRGHKRWEKAASSGYEGVCRYTLQNLLPALDRFMILVSRLRGLSRFYESSAAFGLSTPELDVILDTASCLKFMSHAVLKAASAELRSFAAFSSWMRLEIEVQNTEATSATAEDFPAKYASLDYPGIFEFVQGGMQQSQLIDLCSESADANGDAKGDLLSQKGAIYEDFKKALKDRSKGQRPPSLAAVLSRLDKQCQSIFLGIAAALRRKVRFGDHVPIAGRDAGVFDAIMTVDGKTPDHNASTAVVAFSWKSRPGLMLKRVHLTITNGISAVRKIDSIHVKLPSDRSVLDLRFADEKTLVIGTTSSGSEPPWIARVPPWSNAEAEGGLNGSKTSGENEGLDGGTEVDLSNEDLLEQYIAHVFDDTPPWVPIQVEANGRKGRRALCVVASDRLRFRVFDLDHALETDEQVEDEDQMEVEA